MPEELHDEPSAREQSREGGKQKKPLRFLLGLMLGLGLGLSGGVFWMMRRQDARFVTFQLQTKMSFDLEAVDLKAAYGRADEARTSYQRLLELEPQWTDVLEHYAWFLHTQSEKSQASGALAQALADAQECLAVSKRFYELDKTQSSAQRVLKFAHDQVGDLLVQNGGPGDDAQIFQHRMQSLKLAEAVQNQKGDPVPSQSARELCGSLWRLGDFLIQRGSLGDRDLALRQLTRALEITEKLLEVNPSSTQRVCDVVTSHEKLAAYCQQQGDKAGEEEHSRACYDLLHKRIVEGARFDQSATSLHDQLHARFGKQS